jgi:hypothetical protein
MLVNGEQCAKHTMRQAYYIGVLRIRQERIMGKYYVTQNRHPNIGCLFDENDEF